MSAASTIGPELRHVEDRTPLTARINVQPRTDPQTLSAKPISYNQVGYLTFTSRSFKVLTTVEDASSQ